MTTYKELNFTIEQRGAQMVVLLDNEVQFEISLGNGKEYAIEQCEKYIQKVADNRKKALDSKVLKATNKAVESELDRYLKKVNGSKKIAELGLAFEECEDDTYVLSLDGDQIASIAGVRAFNEMVESASVFIFENGEKIVLEVIVSYWDGHMNLLDISHDIQNFDLKTREQFYTILRGILKELNKNVWLFPKRVYNKYRKKFLKSIDNQINILYYKYISKARQNTIEKDDLKWESLS